MKNVFGPWLSKLRRPLGPMPKAKLDHQFYMSHPQHREKVMAEYNARFPHGPPDGQDALKQRNKIAAEMLQEEPSEV